MANPFRLIGMKLADAIDLHKARRDLRKKHGRAGYKAIRKKDRAALRYYKTGVYRRPK